MNGRTMNDLHRLNIYMLLYHAPFTRSVFLVRVLLLIKFSICYNYDGFGHNTSWVYNCMDCFQNVISIEETSVL